MINHYLKVALRNLLKYKVQTVISIIGLAVGFICFSLSMLWMRYEGSFDDFHSKADRIYRVQYIDTTHTDGFTTSTPFPLGQMLKGIFPEIEEATTTQYDGIIMNTPSGINLFKGLAIDSSFCKIFDVSDYIAFPYYHEDSNGTNDRPSKNVPVAITKRMAEKLFSKESAVGKEITGLYGSSLYVTKEIEPWDENTNITFDFLSPAITREEWNVSYTTTYVLVKPNTDIESFNKKLATIDDKTIPYNNKTLTLIPLNKIKTDYQQGNNKVKHDYIQLFALAGLLISLCAFFNYIMLFINRIRMRQKEFSLRKTNGASTLSLLKLLYAEFLIILLLTTLVVCLLMYFILPAYKELSEIHFSNLLIYRQALVYICILSIFVFLISIFPVYYYQRKTLLNTIQKSATGKDNSIFYKICTVLQIIISIGCVFCTCILMLQVKHLSNLDIGFDRHRITQIGLKWKWNFNAMPYADRIESLPTVEAVVGHKSIMILSTSMQRYNISRWEDMKSAGNIKFEIYDVNPQFIDFMGIDIIKGDNFNPDNPDPSLFIINETALKTLGWTHPIGKWINLYEGFDGTVIGVVKDFYISNPEMKTMPMIMRYDNKNTYNIVYRYKEGTKKETERAITEMIKKDIPDAEVEFKYMDDVYDDYFKSESALLKILGITTIVCIIISIFGIYSMVTLICTRRRKEIAIRKVNGASVWSILLSLLKEYILLLAIASIIIFPVGYKIMSTWLEHYPNRITIDWWIYAAIFFATLIIITLSVFAQVWKAANSNPAEVLKSE